MSDNVTKQESMKELDRSIALFLDSPESTPGFVQECLWRLIGRIGEITHRQRRASTIALTMIVIFELLNRRLINEASLSGVRLSQLDFLRTLAPVGVAYFMLRFASLARATGTYMVVIYRITEFRFPGLHRSELDHMLVYIASQTLTDIPKRYAPYWYRLGRSAMELEIVATFVITSAFFIYAYWQLFSTNGYDDVFVWISAAGSLYFLFLAVAFAKMGLETSRHLSAQRQLFGGRLMGAP